MKVSAGTLSAYHRDGFVRVKGLFSGPRLAELEAELARFIEHEAPLLTGRDINFVDPEKTVINSIHKLHRTPEGFFTKLIDSSEMRAFGAAFIGEDEVQWRAVEAFCKPAGVGMPSPPHQDNYYWCYAPPANALTIWVALDRTSIANGGIHYLSGSQMLGILEHVNSHAPGSSQMLADKSIIDALPQVCPELEPGDALVHHCQTIHWSHSNTSTMRRRGITMQYAAASLKVDERRKEAYTKRLMDQIAARESREA